MELCDSESSAKKSHPQNGMGDLHPFEFEPLSLSLSVAELHIELCDSKSFAKKSHPQNVMWHHFPFEFEQLSLSLSAPLSLLW